MCAVCVMDILHSHVHACVRAHVCVCVCIYNSMAKFFSICGMYRIV